MTTWEEDWARQEANKRFGYPIGRGIGGFVTGPATSSEDNRAINQDSNHNQWGATPGTAPSDPATSNGGKDKNAPTTDNTHHAYDGTRPPRGKPGDYSTRRKPGQSVLDWAKQVLGTWGMDDPAIFDAIKNARNQNDMLIKIRESDAYKKRFAGNIARAEAGFGMLSEAQYLAQEESYRQAMHAAGLPAKFYDSPEDFAALMGGDVSPAEVTARATLAGDAMHNKDPEFVKAMKRMYGLTKGELAAYALDPDRAMPILQRRFDAMELGAEAGRFDIAGAKKGWLNRLVSQGIDQGQAREAFGKVDAISGDLGRLASGAEVKKSTDRQLANNELGVGGKKSRRKAKRDNVLRSQERANLSGGSGGTGMFGTSSSGF